MIGMRNTAAARFLVPALAVLAVVGLISCAGTKQQGARAQPGSDHLHSGRALHHGERLYKVACSSCHGANARGNGPVAPLLTVPVPDITLIASRRGGTFPEDEIYRIVDGQADLTAHGPRHMPVWGYEFFGNAPDDEAAHREATKKVERLVLYLRSIQRTPLN